MDDKKDNEEGRAPLKYLPRAPESLVTPLNFHPRLLPNGIVARPGNQTGFPEFEFQVS